MTRLAFRQPGLHPARTDGHSDQRLQNKIRMELDKLFGVDFFAGLIFSSLH